MWSKPYLSFSTTLFDENQKLIYKMNERCLVFADCNQKIGEAIVDIRSTLEKYGISLHDCREQGYRMITVQT